MLPVTYRVIAYIKRHEPTYQPRLYEPIAKAPLARSHRA